MNALGRLTRIIVAECFLELSTAIYIDRFYNLKSAVNNTIQFLKINSICQIRGLLQQCSLIELKTEESDLIDYI